MKKIALLLCAAAVLASCSREESVEQGGGDDTQAVYLSVGLDNNGFVTGTETEPMTRAGSYSTFVHEQYHVVILKQEAGDWYVERTMAPSISGLTPDNILGGQPRGNTVTGTTQLVTDYRIDLTPGHYQILIVLNNRAAINSALVSGYRITDPAPWAVGYYLVESSYGKAGAKNLVYEIFAGTQEFDVVKQTDLNPGITVQSVDVDVTRRVGTIGIYLKENEVKEYFDMPGSVIFRIRANEGAFCEGIDVFGKPYYSTAGLTEFYGDYYISNHWVETTKGNYHFPVKGQRVSGHFYFTEAGEDVPFTIDYVDMGFQSPGLNYLYEDGAGITGTLRHNCTSHLTFYTDMTQSGINFNIYPEYTGDEAADLFPPDYMWTTAIQ